MRTSPKVLSTVCMTACAVIALAVAAPAAHATTAKCVFGLNDTLGANQLAVQADERNDGLGALRQNATAQRLLTVAIFDCFGQPDAVMSNVAQAIVANTQAMLQNALGQTARARTIEYRDVRGYVVAALTAIP